MFHPSGDSYLLHGLQSLPVGFQAQSLNHGQGGTRIQGIEVPVHGQVDCSHGARGRSNQIGVRRAPLVTFPEPDQEIRILARTGFRLRSVHAEGGQRCACGRCILPDQVGMGAVGPQDQFP